MDPKTILQLLDQERQTVAFPGAFLEKTPFVVRELGPSSNGISYTSLTSSNVDQVIEEEIIRFVELGREFEWKVYSHDQPSDLRARLAHRGFSIGEEECVLVADCTNLPEALVQPAKKGIKVKRATSVAMIDDLLQVEEQVWKSSNLDRNQLIQNLENPDGKETVFVAYHGAEPIGFGRITFLSVLAGLWGGSVLEEYRGLGVYRALLAARVAEAKKHPAVRYVRVDALPTSRPILEKYGFMRIAETWPCVWNGN